MPPRVLASPLLMAFLRTLAFVGITEAVFYRLLPEPGRGETGLLGHLHLSLYQAGNLTFFISFFIVVIALITTAYRALRFGFWPAGLNGALAVCMLCLAALGVTAMLLELGPAFAIGFTLLALATVLFVSMDAFSSTASGWTRAFAVCYCGAVVCSAVGTIARFASGASLDRAGGGRLADAAVSAGELLAGVAGLLAFMAFHEVDRAGARSRLPGLLGALAAGGFVVGCMAAPDRLALLGPDPAPARVLLLSCAVFVGTMTAAARLLCPRRRLRGYGLLLLLLAGFPLRIVYQHMVAVLGAVLLFAPAPVEAAAPSGAELAPLQPRQPVPALPEPASGGEPTAPPTAPPSAPAPAPEQAAPLHNAE